MPAMRRQASLTELVIRPVALGMFGFYLVWNTLWLASGNIPGSILQAFTGIPCPTTGCTRSILYCLQRHWAEALLWNPLTLVYLLLLAWSAVCLIRQFLSRNRLALSPLVSRLWVVSLVAGWAAKFLIGPKYW